MQPSGAHLLRARAVSRLFAFSIASTSSSFVIEERPRTSSRRATCMRCDLLALASTPPAVGPPRRAADPPFAAWLSDGPDRSFGSQWSPTFSCVCLSAANAVRWARSPSPYCSAAESWVAPHVSRAFLPDLATVDGWSFDPELRDFFAAGMTDHLGDGVPAHAAVMHAGASDPVGRLRAGRLLRAAGERGGR